MRRLFLVPLILLAAVLAITPAAATSVFTSNFETGSFAAEGWFVVNGTQTNAWACGTATNNGGTYGGYVSNDAGVTNAYTLSATSVTHFYRDVVLPAGETSISLTFDWRGMGETGLYDYLSVWLVPTTTTPVAGTALTSGQVGINYYNQATYTTATITIPCAHAGTTKRLVFSWKNDGSLGTQPPTALDNISLTTAAASPLTGTYTIDNTLPTGGTNFASFTAAIAALNANGAAVAGVTFDVVSGQVFTEDPPAITAACSAGPIVFQRSGVAANPVVKPTGTAGTADFGLCISGADYVTLDGIDVTINTGSAVEYGILVRDISSTDGAQNCTIKNGKVTLNRANTASIGILQTTTTTGGGVTPTAATGANSNNRYYNMTVENAYDGVYLWAGSAAYPDLNTEFGTTGVGTSTIGAATANDIGNGSTLSWGIRAAAQSGLKIFNTTVRNVTVTGPVNPYGIYLDNSGAGTLGTSEIYGCTVRDIKSTSTSTSSVLYGLRADISTNNFGRVYNNDVFGLTPSNPTTATTTVLLRALCGNAGSNAGTVSFYHNSVRVDQGAALNGSSAAFWVAGGTINSQDNIFANVTGAQTTAKHWAAYVSSGTIATASNNVFYAPNTNGILGYAGAADRTLLEIFAAATSPAAPVNGQEGGSANADPNFTGPADLTFAGATPAAGSGVAIAGILTDITGAPRGNPPTIGAHETANAQNDLSAPVLSGVVIASGGAPTVSVNLADNSAAAANATVQLWYRLGTAGAFTGVDADVKPVGVMNGTYTWNASLSALAVGSYQFYVAARDGRGAGVGPWANPIWTSSFPTTGGWSALDPPNFGTNPATFANTRVFAKTAILPGGTYLVGTDEPVLKKLTDVAAQINTSELTGNVIYELKPTYDGTAGETFPIVINQIVTSGGNWTVTIRPQAGVTASLTGNTASALIKLNGADRVTIDGSNSGGIDRNLTITNSGPVSPCGIWISSLGNGAGATDNTVKNCNINTNAATTATAYGIAVSGATIGSAGGDNDNVTLQNNAINSSNIGIYANGNAAVSAGGMDNLSVIGNAFTTTGTTSPTYGVEVISALMASVRENTFNLTVTTGTPVGISIETNVSNSSVTANQIRAVVTTATGGYGGRGITVGTGLASSNLTIVNNFVAGVNGSNYSSFGLSSAMGIAIGVIGNTSTLTTVAGGVMLYHNSVNMYGDYSYATACLTAGLYVGSGASALNIRNNIIVNSLNNTNASGTLSKNYAVYSAVANTAYAAISYNDYYVSGTQGVLGYLGGDQTTLSAFNTAFTGNPSTPAYNLAAAFTLPTNLRIPAGTSTMLESGGVTGTGVTTDIDNDVRPGPLGSVNGGGTAPDVGADEFDGTPVVNNDVAATAFVDPTNGGTKTVGVGFAPRASFTNLGLAAQTGVQVRYRIVGPAPAVTEIYNQTASIDTLASMATKTVTFPLDTLTVGGTYTIYAASELVGDQTPANDQITGSITAKAPLAGTYLVGTGLFKQLTGVDLTFERRVQTVRREVLEPVDPAPKPLGDEAGMGVDQADQVVWKTVEREVEEVTWVAMSDGRPFERALRVNRADNPDLPAYARDGVYATITAAVADLNGVGVSGPVEFLLTDATYPSETFPIVVNVASGAPTATNTVTFKPNTGVTATVSGASGAGSIFKIFKTNYITIDGWNSVSAGTRDLTLENTSATTPNVVWFGSSGTTPITNGSLKNCVVRNGVNTSSAVVISDGTIAGNAGYFSNMEVRNNKIEKAYIGVYANGGTTPQNGSGLTLADNELNTSGANAMRKVGLYMQGVSGAVVTNNDIGNFEVVTSENDYGIWLASYAANVTVNANRIHDIGYTGTSGYGAKGIVASTGVTAANITISNNMIFNMTGDGDSYSLGCTYSPVGIYAFGTQGGLGIFDNSIFLYGNTINYTATAYSVGIGLDDASSASVSGNNVVNNLGRLSTIGAGAAAIALETGASQLTAGNYNNLYCNSTGGGVNLVGKIGVNDYATMLAWRTASGRDANSISADPQYVGNSNLHIRLDVPSPVSNAGAPIDGILFDYDGDNRSVVPDIGADEFLMYPRPTVSVSDVSVTEGNTGTVLADFLVTLSAVSDRAVSVSALTADSTATVADSDYVAISRRASVDWVAGDPLLVKHVAVTVKGDYNLEPDEVFHLLLTSPVYATMADSLGRCVIINDDDASGADGVLVPERTFLGTSAPNPFGDRTAISFGLHASGSVALEVFDLSGRLVRTLNQGSLEKGYKHAIWDGRDNQGNRLAAGVYFLRMQADHQTLKRTITILR